MPTLRDIEEKFHIYLEVVDAILALSFVKHGRVTDDYRQQAWRARHLTHSANRSLMRHRLCLTGQPQSLRPAPEAHP